MSQTCLTGRQTILSIVLMMIVVLAVTGCKSQELETGWTEQEMLVDGDMSDWSGIPSTRFEDQNVSVSLANDNANLYVLFRFRDMKWARTIQMSGLKLWFDANGKKDKNFSICYKGGPTREEMQAIDGRMGDSTTNRRMPGMMERGMTEQAPDSEMVFTCFIKDRIAEKPIPPTGTEGPAAAFKLDKGTFVYEFSIPLGEIGVRYYGIGAEPGAVVGLGMEWGGFDRDAMQSNMSRPEGGMGGPPGGGTGGGRRGGGMGGRPGGGGGSRPEMPEAQEVWVKTTLAKSKMTQQQDEKQ